MPPIAPGIVDRLAGASPTAADCAWLLEQFRPAIARRLAIERRDDAIQRLGDLLGPTLDPGDRPNIIQAAFDRYQRRRWPRVRQGRYADPPRGEDSDGLLFEIFVLSDGTPPESVTQLRRILISACACV